MEREAPTKPATPRPASTISVEAIQEAISGIRFGVVQIIIQDGKVVQIERTEKIRLT